MVSASSIPKHLWFSFSPSILIFPWFGNSIPSVICRLPLLITQIWMGISEPFCVRVKLIMHLMDLADVHAFGFVAGDLKTIFHGSF